MLMWRSTRLVVGRECCAPRVLAGRDRAFAWSAQEVEGHDNEVEDGVGELWVLVCLQAFVEGFDDGDADGPEARSGGVFVLEVLVEACEPEVEAFVCEPWVFAIQFGEPLADGL